MREGVVVTIIFPKLGVDNVVQGARHSDPNGPLTSLETVPMPHYYVNTAAQPNGDHEVHQEDCQWLPSVANREYLGIYTSCQPAVWEAKRRNYDADGCATCASDCHDS